MSGIQEMKAKQYANLLNENTRKAQYSRTMMFNVKILKSHILAILTSVLVLFVAIRLGLKIFF